MMKVDLPGFDDPVSEAQACFRGVLDAMAHPGRVVTLATGLHPPAPLAPATASVLLTLADIDTPVWLDQAASPARDWVQFHCGVPFTGPELAVFAVCLDLPPLTAFNWGSHDGPETSTTVILQLPRLDEGPALRLAGPGLQAPAVVRLGLPWDFAARWHANRVAFPRGIDLVLCAGDAVAALPRTVSVEAV